MFGGFTSGIGIRYAPSIIVQDAHQAAAAKLVVGERMLPHVFIHAADAKPTNIHDLLPADTRFKILVFVGDVKAETGAAQLRALEERMRHPASFLQRFAHGDHTQIFDVLCFTAAERDAVDYTGALLLCTFPPFACAHSDTSSDRRSRTVQVALVEVCLSCSG